MLGHNATIDIQRLAAVAHYVIAKTDPGKLGYIKLNKILWYADLEHYRWHGETITGLRQYSRMPLGPVSRDIFQAVARLVKDGKVAEQAVKVGDSTRREMVSTVPPDVAMFSDEQIDILNQMMNIIAPLTASQLSHMTRVDPLWNELKNNDAMSIATGSVITPPPMSK